MSDQESNNKTRQDAFERVVFAKFGSLANQPTFDYMTTLRSELFKWIEEIDGAICRHYANEENKRQNKEDEESEDEPDEYSISLPTLKNPRNP